MLDIDMLARAFVALLNGAPLDAQDQDNHPRCHPRHTGCSF